MLLIEAEVRPSSIHGFGLFCIADIPKGTLVWAFHPVFDFAIQEQDLASLPPAARAFLSKYAYRAVETNELMINLDHSRHMNHSDTPNLFTDSDSNYYAAEDLVAGTELTCDYREFALGGCIEFLNTIDPLAGSVESAAG